MYLPYQFYKVGAVFARGWIGFIIYIVASWIFHNLY